MVCIFSHQMHHDQIKMSMPVIHSCVEHNDPDLGVADTIRRTSSSPTDMINQRFEFANALRGPAAIFVLFSHFLHNAWYMRPLVETFANVKLPADTALQTPRYIELLGSIPYFDWGGYGVALFFLISGFVIPLSLKKYSASAFLLGRVFRIWPVYVCGLTITVSAIYAAGIHFGKAFPYTATEVVIHAFPGLRDLLWSKGIDGIVWTLEIEIKFYVLCALLAPLFKKSRSIIFIVPVLIGLLCLSMHSHIDTHDPASRQFKLAYTFFLAAQFIVFMFLGTLYGFWREGAVRTYRAVTLGACLIAIFFALLKWGPLHAIPIQPLGYAAAIVTFLLFAAFMKRSDPVTSFLSTISYPLYVMHEALGYVIIALCLNAGWTPKFALATAFATTISIAYLLHKFIELPFHAWGQRIATRWTTESRKARESVIGSVHEC
jgi:peptidoglycan/LPS O-acetylase OafA/YrhL